MMKAIFNYFTPIPTVPILTGAIGIPQRGRSTQWEGFISPLGERRKGVKLCSACPDSVKYL